KYQKEIERRERTIVGVNDYTVEEDWVPVELLRIHPKVEETQIARLQKLRLTRDNRRVKAILDKLHDEADGNKNLMPTIIEAVKSYATLGEIADVLRTVFGEYRELIIV
ncbi:MAG: methylmalonyl-CoA mutase family protein, partial [Candidatus Bathyarchaeia archaeon]